MIDAARKVPNQNHTMELQEFWQKMSSNPPPNQFNSYESEDNETIYYRSGPRDNFDMMTDSIRSSSPQNDRSAGVERFAGNDDSDEIDYRKKSSQSKSKPKFVEEHKSEEEASDQKLTLNKLIGFQSSEGFWKADSLPQLQKFFTQKLPSHLDSKLICTLAALCILQQFFEDRENEWKLIAKKAVEYLRKNKVSVDKELDQII